MISTNQTFLPPNCPKFAANQQGSVRPAACDRAPTAALPLDQTDQQGGRVRALAKSAAVTLLTGAAVLAGTEIVSATQADSPATAEPPPIVEDYSYPGAAAIFAERGIKLISGDGHIMLTDCTPGNSGLIAVSSSQLTDQFCFKVSGPVGNLKLFVPEVYSIKGDSHSATATVTGPSGDQTTPIKKDSWTPINKGDGATLLELKVWS